ncbi:MAG: DUF4340 domain-containing protein [Saprospiraceae bacterium]|nr:DUF4340 domain-containing protein [Saprospiraceae bacterium]
MKDRTILLIVLLMIIVYLALRYFPKGRDPNFNATFIQLDTTSLASLLITSPNSTAELSLRRTEGQWIASNGQVHIKAPADLMNPLLRTLYHIKTQFVATQSPKDWSEYGVSENLGTRIRIYDAHGLREDFVVGKIQVTPAGKTLSYVRFADANEVYAVEGTPMQNLQLNFDAFRNKNILQLNNINNIQEFLYETPDTLLQFQRTVQGWMLGASLLDSARMERYLQSLQSLRGETFADDFDEVEQAEQLFMTLTIFEDEDEEQFVIHCFRDSTRQMPFIIHSNQNSEAYFASDSVGLYRIVFRNLLDLVAARKDGN